MFANGWLEKLIFINKEKNKYVLENKELAKFHSAAIPQVSETLC